MKILADSMEKRTAVVDGISIERCREAFPSLATIWVLGSGEDRAVW